MVDIVWSERRVNYAKWLAVPEDQGWGTADLAAVWIEKRHALVGDYKHGQGVEVDAKDNEQMMLYAGGVLLELDDLGIEVDTITLAVFQPRIREAPSEWSITRDELVKWLLGPARSAANSVRVAENFDDGPAEEWEGLFLNAGDQCKFCKAKATCPKLRSEVADAVSGGETASTPDEFDDLTAQTPSSAAVSDWLAACLSKVDMIEEWCAAVRAEAFRRLEAGESVPGYKLVQGKRGARAWADANQAEAMLKTFRLKQEEMYEFKLISPTTAEKLAKAETIGKRQWPKLKELITQADGKPSVAPVTDPRPAIDVRPIEEAFENVADDIC